jgi:peptidoglycan-associated lipoprotein
VDNKITAEYNFLKEGVKLTEDFIESLESEEQQEMSHQINRRTEFQVISTEYKSGK